MGLLESKCRYCGSKDHASEDCPQGIFESKCRYCGSTEHSSENCPHGIFESKCRYCGSTDHSSENCPHGIFESKCRYCGSTNHASEDCPHGIFESKCRYCGSANHSSEDCPHGLLGSSSSSRTTTTTQTSSSSSSSSSSNESGCATLIAWLVGIGIVVFVVVWLALNVVLPVALLNSALALVVLSFVFKKYKTLFASLALVGGGYMLLDITNGWLSANFVDKIVKNPDWISAFVYINAAALGLSTWLLIQPIWLKTEQMEPTEKRKSLLLKGALILLIAIATAVAPVIYHSVQNPFVKMSFIKTAEKLLKKNGIKNSDSSQSIIYQPSTYKDILDLQKINLDKASSIFHVMGWNLEGEDYTLFTHGTNESYHFAYNFEYVKGYDFYDIIYTMKRWGNTNGEQIELLQKSDHPNVLIYYTSITQFDKLENEVKNEFKHFATKSGEQGNRESIYRDGNIEINFSIHSWLRGYGETETRQIAYVVIVLDISDMNKIKAELCPNCNGSGYTYRFDENTRYIKETCTVCSGSGKAAKTN